MFNSMTCVFTCICFVYFFLGTFPILKFSFDILKKKCFCISHFLIKANFKRKKKNKLAMKGEDHANVNHCGSFVTGVYVACRVNH